MTGVHSAETPTVLAPDSPNAIGRMLGLLGDEWNLLIIQQALLGASRYSQFMSRLPISNSVLTNRLRTLVGDGLLTRKVHASTRARTEYLITSRGRSLWPTMLAIWEWERNWVTEHRETLPAMRHVACGSHFAPLLRCNTCHAAVTGSEVELALGPSGDWASRRRPPRPGVARSPTPARGRPDCSRDDERVRQSLGGGPLVAAFLGSTRFTDFQSQLGAPPSLLAERLQTFCTLGVFTTSPAERSGPERAAYLLTDKGRAFFPVLTAALQWAQWWFQAPEGPAVVMTHHDCGTGFTGELACDQCTERLTGAEVSTVAI